MRRALLFILCVGIFPACENDIKKVRIVEARKELPLLSEKDVDVIYSDSSRVKVRVLAPYSEKFELPVPYIEFPKGVKTLFFNDSLKVSSTLTANYAINREKERKMEARGNVVITNDKGEMLNTEKLYWDENTQKIYTDQFVKITTPDKIIFGEGFEAKQDFSTYRIFKIKGTIFVKNDAKGT